jgi:hypothetical protein
MKDLETNFNYGAWKTIIKKYKLKPNAKGQCRLTQKQWEEGIAIKDAKTGMMYVSTHLQRPKGWILAHNQVLHSRRMLQGVQGFRYFWLRPSKTVQKSWVICNCGWRPEWGTHYRNSRSGDAPPVENYKENLERAERAEREYEQQIGALPNS